MGHRCSQCPQVFEDEQSKHEHEMEAHVNAPLDDSSTREKVTCEFCDKVVYKGMATISVYKVFSKSGLSEFNYKG